MKPSFSLFWTFIKNLGKNWILRLSLALDLLAVFFQFIIPSINLPQGFYVLVSMVGLVWASFDIYLDLLSRIPSEARPLKPVISLFFIEGEEYSYRFEKQSDIYLSESQETHEDIQAENSNKETQFSTLPKARITYHMRIENLGFVPVNLLTIRGDINLTTPYHFMIPEAKNIDGTPVSFPVILSPKELLNFHVVAPIFPYDNLTDAQIAARTRELREDRTSIEVVVFTEAIDPAGKIYNFRAVHQISLLPLCNLYTSFWKGLGRHEMVALATGETNSNIKSIY